MGENTMALWRIGLNCTCPGCGEWVDLIPTDDGNDEVADFWEQFPTDMGECLHNSKDIEVECPKCHHKFEIDCEY